MHRVIMHVDMDAFFASVEQRDNPELMGQPVIVGGSVNNRGVVSAASYEARKFGVRSAMAMAKALQLCPQAIRLPVNSKAYSDASKVIMNILRNTADLVEPVSIDEAYLDITSQTMDFEHAEAIGRRVKKEILYQTQLTASIGLAPNKFLAKVASDYDKPDGFFMIKPHDVESFLAPLPVRLIPGVGAKTDARLEKMEIRTIENLRDYPLSQLVTILGDKHGYRLYQLARGIDTNPVQSHRLRKSVSQERTFSHDIRERSVLKMFLNELSSEVSEILVKKKLKGRSIGLKIRFDDFQIITRSVSLDHFTQEAEEIADIANVLFDRVDFQNRKVRLIGVRVASLDNQAISPANKNHSPTQLTFWE